jgi:signal transduction histidine kinase
LRDHIPDFLESLAVGLRESGTEASEVSSQLADAHGAVRWEQGFDLREVVGDYAILHEAILTEVEQAGLQLTPNAARRLVQHIAGGISSAVESHVARQAERDRAGVEKLEEVQRVRQEFLSNLSHELRTPLHVLTLSTQLIRSGVPQQRLESALAVIERNIARESKLVEELLDMAAMSTGRVRLSWSRVDLESVTREVVVAVRPTAVAKGIQLHEDAVTAGPEVQGDRTRLYQCIWQLLMNAVKFSPAGGHVWVSLEVSERKQVREIELAVRDTGPGIAKEFMKHVFDPFAQQDGSTTRMHEGLGIGLSLVRHIVELHGGTIAVESSGEGATFRVRLPPKR